MPSQIHNEVNNSGSRMQDSRTLHCVGYAELAPLTRSHTPALTARRHPSSFILQPGIPVALLLLPGHLPPARLPLSRLWLRPKIVGINAINSLFSNGKLTAECWQAHSPRKKEYVRGPGRQTGAGGARQVNRPDPQTPRPSEPPTPDMFRPNPTHPRPARLNSTLYDVLLHVQLHN